MPTRAFGNVHDVKKTIINTGKAPVCLLNIVKIAVYQFTMALHIFLIIGEQKKEMSKLKNDPGKGKK